MKVVAIAGGTGSAKLLRGLVGLGVDLTVVSNVGDNIWMHGLYVCPDLDIAMYSLAGIVNRKLGWGLEGDTFHALAQLERLGQVTWFSLGDRDIVTSIIRTNLLRSGRTLTAATEDLRKAFRVKQRLLPVTDEPVETHIVTPIGEFHLQEFWVRDHGLGAVEGVKYIGSSKSKVTRLVEKAILEAARIIICPANPVTSIGPMLAVPGFGRLLAKSGARISSLSPLIGRAPFSGPAAKLMKAVGLRPDSVGVARRYSDFLNSLVIDRTDAKLSQPIKRLGVDCRLSDIAITGLEDAMRLAKELLDS